jgi:hypothetical protein
VHRADHFVEVNMTTEAQQEMREQETAAQEGAALFEQGMAIGREWAESAAQGFSEWAERSPEQVVLVGLALGFVLGKLFSMGERG